jgi:hypoxanthine phosphoribosyltransferase
MGQVSFGWEIVDEFRKRVLERKGQYDCIVGILRGGAIPAVVASNLLDVKVCWLEAESYINRKRQELKLNNLTLDSGVLRGKRVLLCDDISDSGQTILDSRAWVENLTDRLVDVFVLVSKNPKWCRQRGIEFIKEVDKENWVCFPWE